jgi:hypothetical protein
LPNARRAWRVERRRITNALDQRDRGKFDLRHDGRPESLQKSQAKRRRRPRGIVAKVDGGPAGQAPPGKLPASGQWRKKFVERWRAANKKPGEAGLFSNTEAKNPYPWRAFIRGFFLLIT